MHSQRHSGKHNDDKILFSTHRLSFARFFPATPYARARHARFSVCRPVRAIPFSKLATPSGYIFLCAYLVRDPPTDSPEAAPPALESAVSVVLRRGGCASHAHSVPAAAPLPWPDSANPRP